MNEPKDQRGTEGTPKPSPDSPKQARLVLLALLAVAAATILGVSYDAPKRAAKVDTATAAVQRGIAAFDSGHYGIALKELEPIANKGNAQAAYWLGRIYDEGLGVKRNARTAVSWYRKAAEGGLTDAKLQLGELYFKGTEELQDFKKARKWLEQAALDGNARAQLDLARLYANGWGGGKDPIQAYVWYEFAAKQGDHEAERLRDGLLKTLREDQIAEAQRLAEKMASGVIGSQKQGAS